MVQVVPAISAPALATAPTIDGDLSEYADLDVYEIPFSNLWEGETTGEADLTGCDLTKADLREADLERAEVRQAKLAGADLRGANVAGIRLQDVGLKGARMDHGQALLFARCHGIIVE